MLKDSRVIEINCEAPSYPIVEACARLGFKTPLDVRWCRMSRVLEEQKETDGFFSFWRRLFGGKKPQKKSCTCGQALPYLDKFGFIFPSGIIAKLRLGQCSRCRTIFWGEDQSARRVRSETLG